MISSKDYSGPIRPPRASKASKESSGHLMNIIGALSISQDNVDRDREKAKLEKDFKRSDQRLDDLVAAHQDELTTTMQAFSKISSKIRSSKEKCQSVKEKLTTCKKLLNCKRDELKRLWLEAVEHKQVLHMLKEIEGLMGVPEKIEECLNNNQYFQATELLVSSTLLLEGSLDCVDALNNLKAELFARRENLHHILVQELHKHLYLTPTTNILRRFKRQGSGRLRSEAVTPSKMIGLRLEQTSTPQTPGSKFLQEIQRSPAVSSVSFISQSVLSEDRSFTDLEEEDTQNSISMFVECLSLLNRIPETVEILKERCQRELMAIVRRTAQHVVESAQNVPFTYCSRLTILGSTRNQEQQHLLNELFELIFEQFKCVSHNHQCLLSNLHRMATQRENEDQHLYEMADIWSKIQAVLEIFVGEYVDIHNTAATQQPAPPSFSKVPSTTDIASYFQRKRNLKHKKYALFKFDSSSHAISMKTYLQEQKDALKEKGEIDMFDTEQQVFICQPATKNITLIFKPLSKFITEIEQELNMEPGSNCPLYTFLSSCVKVFLGQITMEVNHLIEIATKSLEIWKTVTNSDMLKNAGVKTFLMHSTVCLNSSLKELKDFIYSIPIYSNHFLHIICNMLQSYKELCQTAYSGLVQPHSEDKRIISASWARDKDISRLLRSLPNWTNLKDKDITDYEESPEDIRLRNKKESEILIANLSGDTLISQHEILLDPGQLRNLSLLHESMEWISSQILNFANSLPKQQCHLAPLTPQNKSEDDIEPIPDVTVESLVKVAKEYGNLADTCLLVLHLEVRVHCFYFLQPLAIQGCYANRVDNQEPDPEVVKLNVDLSKIDEAVASVLKQRNIKFMFEGLGELISTILINSANRIKRINENGVKKMGRNIFAIQQNLTGITMFREVALDRARQFFDLLNHTHEEILNLIVENGPQFQELEYYSVFHLLHRSKPGSDSVVLTQCLSRLHQILNEVAVSV